MNIFLTLDYELFMGYRPGTPMNCLIEPMNALTAVVEKYGARFVIFVDAAYLYRLKQLSSSSLKAKEDLNLVSHHLQDLNAKGHDIELHFHPQWLFSDYSNSGWSMDLKHYKLADLNLSDVYAQFKETKNILDNIIERQTIAFRAGGYSLNSFNDYIKLLRDNAIKIDSSVLRGKFKKGNFQSYNYAITPNKSSYRFSDNVCVEDVTGDFVEYPITTSHKMPGWKYMLKKRKLISIFGDREEKWSDGVGIGVHLSRKEFILSHIRKFLNGTSINASIDGFNVVFLGEMYQTLKMNDIKDMVIIGHPKNASIQSIVFFDRFLSIVSAKDKITTFLNEK